MIRTAILITMLIMASHGRALAAPAEAIDFFEKKIRPVLVEKCYSCHSAEAKKVRGGLRLDTREAILRGGDSGPALVPGDPAKSLLMKALRYEDGMDMPPSGRLADTIIKDFERWIVDGAQDPRTGDSKTAAGIDIAKGRQFWSFRQPKSHPQPVVQQRDWLKQPIDAFILAKLESQQLTPAPVSDRLTFLRRVSFDLTGLPPTPEEADAFLHDERPDAKERLIERLLASPHHGERWARVWLDVARYGEDQAHIVGNDQSLTYPNAYLYRDWVIQAFNADMPYDRFIKLQLAADVFEGNESPHRVALGYLGLGPKYYQRNSLAVMAEEWEDRVDVIGRGMLGLTLACARCHDHKFDPIPTTDYYGIAGVFSSTQMLNQPIPGWGDKPNKNNAPVHTMHIVQDGKVADLTVFIRGNVENKGPTVPRRFLSVLSTGEPKPFSRGSGRADLADAIADRNNPLTARVIVNRVWAQYFGRGIVATAGNFGTLGEAPTHPELLDDLAVRFMEHGWSVKWLHREIALSATYAQSSIGDPKTIAADADNRWLGRMPRRRLPVESWRDAIVHASNRLDTAQVGGKSIDPLDPQESRRTVYAAISRLEVNKLLAMFDFPDPNVTADRRVETITPLQKLFTLNSPFMVAQGQLFMQRLLSEIPNGDEARIDRAYRLLFARPATTEERSIGLRYILSGDDRAARWQRYAHALLAQNELWYLD